MTLNPFLCIDLSISDSLRSVRKSVLIYETIIEKCGRINMTENENIFYFIPKRITEEGINNLKDVNKTYEFYDEYREIVINKKVAQIIKENIPYAKFYPVILDNRN